MPPETASQTTPDETAEAFLRVCEALGIQATRLAYLDVPAVLSAAKANGVAKAISVIEGGSFLHDDAPDARFAREVVAAIKRETA